MSDDGHKPGPTRQRLSPPTSPLDADERPADRLPLNDPAVTAAPEADPQDGGTSADGADETAAKLFAGSFTGRGGNGWILRCLIAGLGLGVAAFAAWLVDSAVAAIGDGSVQGMLTAAALGLIALALAGAVAIEVRGLLRLRSRGNLRTIAEGAIAGGDSGALNKVLTEVQVLHSNRPDLEWIMSDYRDAAADVPDAVDRLALYEQMVLAPLDEAAVAETSRLVRRCAILTALVPNPLLEAGVVLWLNLRVVRAVAEVQGMRPGLLGSGVLIRQTAAAMVAAGAMEVLHDIAPSAVAGGVAQRVAGKLGQGAVNGFLTARLGVAALEATRPLPFNVRPRPSAREIATRAVTG